MCPDQGPQIASIGHKLTNKRSWESLSSTFSNLEISFSHDSCYASDEVSTTSTNPTTVDTSIISSSTPATESSCFPLKPILKRPFAEIEEDEESESGYVSGASDHEDDYDALSDEDDDICYVTAWDEDSEAMSEYYGEDDTSADECSFISFESMVRFDPNVSYIEATPYEDETPGPEMTCHEMMELAKASGNLTTHGEPPFTDNEGYMDGCLADAIKNLPEEHPDDSLDLDKRLFVAYMNGINGLSNANYKERLRTLARDMTLGQAKSPYLESDNASGVYFDNALNHVIGTFRNIILDAEFDELVKLGEETGTRCKEAGTAERPGQNLVNKIEDLLSERLGSDTVNIGPEELGFFAGGIAFAIQNWKVYMTR